MGIGRGLSLPVQDRGVGLGEHIGLSFGKIPEEKLE